MMTSKSVRVSSGGRLLLLGFATLLQGGDIALAANEVKGHACDVPPGLNALRAEQDVERGSQIISGDVISMDGDYFVIQDEQGKEVSLLSDRRTDKPVIEKGDHITAYVDDEHYALWIRSNESTDRRSEHASLDCNPN